MQEDPNYNEVSSDVDMHVDEHFPEPVSLIKRILNKILLIIKNIWNGIWRKKETYAPEVVGLKYIHLGDLTEEKLKEMGRNPCKLGDYTHEEIAPQVFHSKDDALKAMFSDQKPAPLPPNVYIVRNRKSGVVMVTKGSIESIRAQFNNDYEIVEAAIKE